MVRTEGTNGELESELESELNRLRGVERGS